MASRTRFAPQGGVNLRDLQQSVSQTRTNFTRVRGFRRVHQSDSEPSPDLITFVSLVSEIYRKHGDELVPVQQYPSELETAQGKGHTSLVSHAEISRLASSTFARGARSTFTEGIIIKRPRHSVLEKETQSLTSFITELRIRFHGPLRSHPNIALLHGVGWDFEDEEATIPRPILLEELAPLGSMDNFWKHWNFVRMTFESKLEFCRDIAKGLEMLHLCGVVHGDVKPENILVFPRRDTRDSFMVKLTDFGHSVLQHDNMASVPAFTRPWSAPEVTKKSYMSFEEMTSTDVYSYGLVILSVMIGRAFHSEFVDVESYKANNSILRRSVELVEAEDRENQDSDLDIGTIILLFRSTLQLSSKLRSLRQCISIFDVYKRQNQGDPLDEMPSANELAPVPRLDVVEKVSIGYQTFFRCSYQLKNYLVRKLLEITKSSSDARKLSAAWELSICYFSGFGTQQSFSDSSHWLSVASNGGLKAAQDHLQNIHKAMGVGLASIPVQSPTATPYEISYPPDASTRDTRASTAADDTTDQTAITRPVARDQPPYDRQECCESLHDQTPMPDLTYDVLYHGSLDDIRSNFETDSSAINSQDMSGNTPLIIAAKTQRYELMKFLLSHPAVDASICNKEGQSVLHYLTDFHDSQIQQLMPLLISAKADPNLEGLPAGNSKTAISGIRSCSILNSILHNNLCLLECLLTGTHAAESLSCQICEAGSKFRRILAVSLSLFRADALEMLVEHIKTYKDGCVIELDEIKVWAGRELLALNKVPFYSVAVAALDLPDSFFRAMYHGDCYLVALERSISFVLDTSIDPKCAAYSMMQAAVNMNCVDGVMFLLRETKRRGLSGLWWLQQPFDESPLMRSIDMGLRDIFDAFLRDNKSFLLEMQEEDCTLQHCRQDQTILEQLMSIFLDESVDRKSHSHPFNSAKYALDRAVSARHQDTYFVQKILNAASHDLIVPDRGSYNTLLMDAIMNSSFKAAELLSDHYPELWEAITYNGNSGGWFNSPALDRNFRIVQTGLELVFGTTIEAVLHQGSYEQCQFVMKIVSSIRNSEASRNFPWIRQCKAMRYADDGGYPSWQQCRLKHREYHALLTGNIFKARDDRQPLWNIIKVQVAMGQPTSVRYLRGAIAYGNVDALRNMLDIGWKPNPPFWLFFMAPLQLSETLMRTQILMDSLDLRCAFYSPLLEDILLQNSGTLFVKIGRLETHANVYSKYQAQFLKAINSLRDSKLKECQDILRHHGSRPALSKTLLGPNSKYAKASALILYLMFYLVCLPITSVTATKQVWTSMTMSQKFGFAYLWAIIAMCLPPYLLVLHGPPQIIRVGLLGNIIWYTTCASALLINHILLPVLIIRQNWQPFVHCERSVEFCQLISSCRNYSYLLPIPVGAFEFLIGYFVYFFGDGEGWW